MTIRVLFKTLPYFILRLVAYLIFGIAIIVFLAIMGAVGFLLYKIFKGAAAPLLIVALVAILGLWGLVRLLERYILYLVKAGHVTVITELVQKGELPAGTNQISYGKDKVVKHFGETSVLFAVDQLVSGSVRQILGWLTQLAGCLASIPGLSLIISLAKRMLSLAANYIDEAILSYIVSHEGENVWKAASDGVVLYAQSWKQLLKTAAFLVFIIIVGWVVAFIIFLVIFLGIARGITSVQNLQIIYGFIGLAAAYIIACVLKWIFVDPLATVVMIVSYNQAIQDQTPSYDLYSQLSQASSKFRQLSQKAEEASPPSTPKS